MEYPQRFIERMTALCGDAWEFSGEQPQRGLRVNTLKATAEAVAKAVPLQRVPFCEDGFAVAADHKAGADPLHHAGAYYMQEPSAMSAVTVLAPQPEERVLDLCAAPGGKSTQIAAALGGKGILWCNEYVPARARILIQNLERCGVTNAAVTNLDTGVLCRALPEWFDAVLVDAPCSGEGMFRKEPDALAMWSEDNIRLCAERAAGILDNAAMAVRPGGRLVLSTCTFAPEENELQVAAFLRRHPEFTLQAIETPFGRRGFSAAELAAFGDGGNADLTGTRRIFPADGGEGHFVALLRKSGDAEESRLPVFTDSKDADAVRKAMSEWTAVGEGVLCRFGEQWHWLPPALPNVQKLPLLYAGVPCATVCKNRLEPTHAWAMAFGGQMHRQCNLPADSEALRRYLHGESIPCEQRGWTAVTADGIPTGLGKADGRQLKNHYPKGLRLLNI